MFTRLGHLFAGISGNKKFLAAAASAAITCAVFVSAYILLVRHIRSSWQVLAGSRQEFLALEHRREDLLLANRTYVNFTRERDAVRAAFVDPANPLPFIEGIEVLGRRDHVTTDLQLTEASGAASGAKYTLSAKGAFKDVITFLGHLESLPFLVELGDTGLNRIESAVPSKGVEASVLFTTTVSVVMP